MDKKVIGYWVATGLFAVAMGAGGVMDVLVVDSIAETLTHLGYPLYFGVILGVGKLLGVVAILAPKFPRLKEWAYAGFTIDLLAGAISHGAVGDGIDKIAPPLGLLAVGAASYLLRPPSRRLYASAS